MENYEVKETRVIVEEREPNRWRIALITGGIGGLLVAAVTHATRVMTDGDMKKMENAGFWNWLPYIIILGTLIWAIVWYKRQWLEPEFPFGAGFKTGLASSLVMATVVALYTYITTHILIRDTEKLTQIKEQIAEGMIENQPNITDEQLERNMRFAEWFFNPLVAGISYLIMFFLIGLVFSMVVSIFTQTRSKTA